MPPSRKSGETRKTRKTVTAKPTATRAGKAASERKPRALESLFQEVVRRGATLGLSSFFLTEEAVRRALSDAVPQDWVEYVAEQSNEVRRDLLDRLVREFGAWLDRLDTQEFQRSLLKTLLDEYELTLTIDVSARPRSGTKGATVTFLPRRR